MNTNTIKADAMMMAKHMRELAENIEYEVEHMNEDNAYMGFGDTHRAQANRDSLSLWREAARFRRVLYGREKL